MADPKYLGTVVPYTDNFFAALNAAIIAGVGGGITAAIYYALIGDCEAAALVARNGSLDWLCWPRFDSDACFARLLGNDSHGFWRIAPQEQATATTRRYRKDTLILETRFATRTGSVVLTDFMLPRG